MKMAIFESSRKRIVSRTKFPEWNDRKRERERERERVDIKIEKGYH